LPRKGPDWATEALPPKEAMTVDVGTLAQTSEPLGVELAVAVGVADPAGGRVGEAEGDVDEQAVRPASTMATATVATPALDGRRNSIDTMVADSSTRGPPVKAVLAARPRGESFFAHMCATAD
jgi:hypothetical protein